MNKITLDNFIEKLIQEYQEHFKKGNSTLGTLPSDWEAELFNLVHGLCEEQKKECARNIIKEAKENYGTSIPDAWSEDSILNAKNVCDE